MGLEKTSMFSELSWLKLYLQNSAAERNYNQSQNKLFSSGQSWKKKLLNTF
jgi:hypothetical protein